MVLSGLRPKNKPGLSHRTCQCQGADAPVPVPDLLNRGPGRSAMPVSTPKGQGLGISGTLQLEWVNVTVVPTVYDTRTSFFYNVRRVLMVRHVNTLTSELMR